MDRPVTGERRPSGALWAAIDELLAAAAPAAPEPAAQPGEWTEPEPFARRPWAGCGDWHAPAWTGSTCPMCLGPSAGPPAGAPPRPAGVQ